MKKFLLVLLTVTASLSFASCTKDAGGHYVYVGPSVGANVGYNGVSVGIALYGPNPSAANVSVVSNQPTPAPVPTAKDGP